MAPYVMLTAAGHSIDVASMQGGAVPIDPASLQGDFVTAKVTEFQANGADRSS